MNDFEIHHFSVNRKLMSFIGVWYTQSYRKRVFRHYVISFVLLFRILAQVCQLCTLNFDLRSTVPVMQSLIPSILFAMLYYTSILHYMTVQKILSFIRQDWQQLKNDVELKIMKKHAHQTKLFTLICGCTRENISYLLFYLFISFSILSLFLRIILTADKVVKNTDRFPIFSCYNYLLNRDTYYYPIVICQAIILIVSTTVGLACYSSYFWFIQHVCARLSIIKTEIRQQFENKDNKDTVHVTPIDCTRWMIGVIKHLARTVEFMNLVNALAEQCYLFQMLLAFFLVVIDFLCLFQIPILLEHKENRKDILVFITFIFVTVFPIYVNCHMGQKLIDYSVDVYKEACAVPIHEISLKAQKLLLITLIICARPCVISIGQVFVSSHEFFSDLIRKSLSFSMVLHSTQKY